MFARRRPHQAAAGANAAQQQSNDEMEDSHQNNPSTVASLAHTLVSTIADGVVHTIAHWKVILLGQGVSIVLAIAGATNEVLATECKVSAPSLYNACGFLSVAIYGGIKLRRDAKKNNITNHQETAESSSSEEQESFKTANDHHQQSNDDCNNMVANEEDDVDVDDDELTLDDDDSPTKRFSFLRGRGNNNNNHHSRSMIKRPSNGSHGSNSKIGQHHPTYPFLFGLYQIHAKWYYYAGVSLIEAQAYYFIFLAFRYTSFAFVYVSDALAIPSSMVFSILFLKRSYRWTHLIGCAICMFGIVINTASDMKMEDDLVEGGDVEDHISDSDHIKGDIFAIFGAILLGLDDVLSEMIMDYGGVTEMLFMKGTFGALISVIQLFIFERESVYALFSADGSSCDVSFRIAMFAAHITTRGLDVAGEMTFLFVSEAALLNILLLSSDLYAAIFDVIAIGYELTGYFYLAFLCIVVGIVLYEAGPSPAESGPTTTPMAIEFSHKEKRVDETSLSVEMTEHAGNLTSSVLTQQAGNLTHASSTLSTEQGGNLSYGDGMLT